MAIESLKTKTVKGTLWSAADVFLSQGVSFLVGIVLARLLSPEEYGLIGIVLIFITVLGGIVDIGIPNAIVRKKDATDQDYNTMFITNMGMSVMFFILLYFFAPFIANFFYRPELTLLTRVMGLMLILQALSITQNTILTKRINFKIKTKASLISAVISGIIGITMAYMGFGVWSLVAQKLSSTMIFTLCMWKFITWWPKSRFSTESFHYMWGFGWKMMLSGILNNTWNQLYQVVVGKFYSPATLGQYSRSKEYANIFSSYLTAIISRVTYPVLAEVQDEKERMVEAYRKIIKVTMFITAVLMISLGAVAEPFIFCLIGPKWYEAAGYLPLICISMSMYPLQSINLNMLQVQGRSDIFLYLEIIKKIVAIGPLCLGIFVGIYWMLIGSIITGFINFFLNSWYTGKSLGYSSWMQLKDISPSYILSLIVAIPIFFLKYLPYSYWVIFPIQIIIGTTIFFIICETTKMEEYDELKEIAKIAVKKVI